MRNTGFIQGFVCENNESRAWKFTRIWGYNTYSQGHARFYQFYQSREVSFFHCWKLHSTVSFFIARNGQHPKERDVGKKGKGSKAQLKITCMHGRFSCKTRLYKATTFFFFFCFLKWLTSLSDGQLWFTPVRGPTKKLELQRRKSWKCRKQCNWTHL